VGRSPRFQTIICGALCLDVTENGNAALQHLRRKLGKFTIWIDAICINQKDKIEKEQQIPLMGDVYSRAEKAYMWLGEGNEKSDRAMAFLARSGLLEYFPIEVAEEGSAPKPRTWAALWSFYNTSLRYGSGDLLPSTSKLSNLIL